jgi:hypothetical protein
MGVRWKWAIRCYLENGMDAIDQWYQAQPEELQAKFDARIRYLREQPITSWKEPYFKNLERDGKGLGEVRFEFHNVQYRPLGYFSDRRFEFVLLLVATKKGNTFDPRNAIEIGQDRKQLVRSDWQRYSRDCEF